jgi:biopolymer transport protein ExbB
MKHILLLTTFFLLPVLASAQSTETDGAAPATPVPEVASDLVAPTAPAAPTAPEAPIAAPSNGSDAPDPASLAPTPAGSAETGSASPDTSTTVSDQGADAAPAPVAAPAATPLTLQERALSAAVAARTFLRDGGPSIWAIAALSVITLALILWKIWRLALIGAWSRGKARQAIAAYQAGDSDRAIAIVEGRRGVRSKVISAALNALKTMPDAHAREETARVAKRELASARSGLGALELISTIAPLLGLLGTVLGMIAAFQALQAAGSKADPSMLAGGIWEALLTTAAGMAVAIPASAALTWFEAVIDRIRRDVEDGATRLFVSDKPQQLRLAAE